MKKIKALLFATRFPFLSVTVIPVLASLILIYKKGISLDLTGIIAVLLVTALGHLAANCMNDYADWDESDRINEEASPFNGGSRFFLEKELKKKDFLYLSLILFILTAVIWLYFVFSRGKYVFFIGLTGILCGLLYSQKSFSFQKRGLGEILIFIAFGPILTMGTGAVFGAPLAEFVPLGVPFGLITLNIIFLNEIPDYKADKIAGKRNWVVRMGRDRALKAAVPLHLSIFLSLALLSGFRLLPFSMLWLLIPLSGLSLFHLISLNKEIQLGQKSLIMFQQLSGLLIAAGLFIWATP